MNQINELIEKLKKFRDDRNWSQFHTSKDLALAISIEASELNELFLWKNNDSVDTDKLEEELADVLIFVLLLAEKHGLDIHEIIRNKISINEKKYPIEKSKGTAKKYMDL